VFRNIFSVIVSFDGEDIPNKSANITFARLQKWIEDRHGVKISKSSITQVKNKCGISKFVVGNKCDTIPELKTEKEKLVLEAFRYFEVV